MSQMIYEATLTSENMNLLLMVLAERVETCHTHAAEAADASPAAVKYWTKQAGGAEALRHKLIEIRGRLR